MPQDNDLSSQKEQREAKTILIVEDDHATGAFFMQAILQETPYQPLLVTNGLEALKIVRDIKPNLFLLDYRLPHMNGLELYDHLHAIKELKDIPAILMTAGPLEGELESREIVGLSKPFELDVLLHAVEELLAS